MSRNPNSYFSPYLFSATVGQTLFQIRTYVSRLEEEKQFTQLPHRHFSAELQYVFGGSEIIHYGPENTELVLQEEDCCLIPKECYHDVYIPERVLRLCFNWRLEPAPNPSSGDQTQEDQKHIQNLYDSLQTPMVIRDKQLTEMIGQYRDFLNFTGELASMEKGVSLLHIILHTLNLVSKRAAESAEQRSSPSKTDNRKFLIEEFICDNCMNPNGLKKLAKFLYLSERQTRTLVLKTIGKNYKDLVIQQRMEQANYLLKDFSLSLEEISQKVGYRSYSGFYLAYVKYYGLSPEEQRRKFKS